MPVIKAGLPISVDGHVAGLEQSLEHPIGVGTQQRVSGDEIAGEDRAAFELCERESRAPLYGRGEGG